ncbi:MAG TPA: sulfatase-like hydrolase/transferase [Planctomycetaceae bacterium]|nr:sulfatase-like hydrolase/transferase [Planctomycetaceae bacterium]
MILTDDQGWGEMGYYEHPVLKTPNLDAMAANGLRFDRFYAGAPNCSPTRATVMTGRTNDRTGVQNHGVPLRLQERTLAQALKNAGYATGHFGKWHLNGLRGPGAPVLAEDVRNPGAFGFETWLSVTNFFDRDPIMSRNGEFEEFEGDSSEIIVAEALMKFIRSQTAAKKPFLSVIWYGTPHSPFVASDDDKSGFADLKGNAQNHYGELVAMDRSVGTLRTGLSELGIAENTLVWFCSDNGGLPGIQPGTVGGLRGFKNSVYEGGLRVPAIIEWPAGITTPRVSKFPAVTMDIFPTLAEIVGLPDSVMIPPQDGMSLKPLFSKQLSKRDTPLGFRHTNRAALIDNNYKILTQNITKGEFELYDLDADPEEKQDLFNTKPDLAEQMRQKFLDWNASVEASVAGRDYPEGKVVPIDPPPRTWMTLDEYKPYLPQLRNRPEYRSQFK